MKERPCEVRLAGGGGGMDLLRVHARAPMGDDVAQPDRVAERASRLQGDDSALFKALDGASASTTGSFAAMDEVYVKLTRASGG